MQFQLRNYQISTISHMLEAATKCRKVLYCLPTGAGKTVIFSEFAAKYTDNVLIVVHRKELFDQVCKSLSRLGIIYGIVKSGKPTNLNRVSVAMVETLNNRIKKETFYDTLLVIDECHVGNFKKIKKDFPFYFGFSATPIATTDPPLSDYYDELFVPVTVGSLIDNGYLAEPELIAPDRFVLDLAIDHKTGDFDERQMNEKLSKVTYITACAQKYAEYCFGKKTLIFCPNVQISQEVAKLIPNSRHLDYLASDNERTATIEWFKNTPGAVLVNVALLTTGFDTPETEAIIINRPTKSLPLYMQMVGRGSRVTESKKKFAILDLYGCCHLETIGFWESNKDWEVIWQTTIRKTAKGGEMPLKLCTNCRAMIAIASKICKYCGHDLIGEKFEDIELIEEVKIISIAEKEFERIAEIQRRKNLKEFFVLFAGIEKMPTISHVKTYAALFAEKYKKNESFVIDLAIKKYKEKNAMEFS